MHPGYTNLNYRPVSIVKTWAVTVLERCTRDIKTVIIPTEEKKKKTKRPYIG